MTEHTDIPSLTELTNRQQDTGAEIQRMVSNYKRDGESRKTLEYLQKRLKTLDQLWFDFEHTDTQIRTHYGQRMEHSYFEKSYYEGIQAGYNDFKEQLRTKLQVAMAEREANLPLAEIAKKVIPENTADQTTTWKILEDKATYQNLNLPGDTTSKSFKPVPITRTSDITNLIGKQQSLIAMIRRSLMNLQENMQHQALQIKTKTIERHFLEVQNLHYKIWDRTESPTAAGYDVETYFTLEDEVQQRLAQLYEQMNRQTITATHTTASAAGASSNNPVMVRLPKISLPTFDGDYLRWRQFRDLFIELVHNQPIANCQKLWYLKTSLSGDAERLIRHLSATEINYATAWQIINDRYENSRLLVNALLNKLLSQPSMSVENSGAIKNMHDSTQECLLALQNLGIPTDQWDPLVLHILVKKLDKGTHTLWEQSLAQPRRLQPLKDFLDFLEKRFQSLEALGNKGRALEERRVNTVRSLASTATTGMNCLTCKGNHKLFACQQFLQMSP